MDNVKINWFMLIDLYDVYKETGIDARSRVSISVEIHKDSKKNIYLKFVPKCLETGDLELHISNNEYMYYSFNYFKNRTELLLVADYVKKELYLDSMWLNYIKSATHCNE